MKIKRSEASDGKIELQVTAPVDKVNDAIKFIDFQLAMQNGIDPNSTEDLSGAVKEKVGEAYYNSFVDFQVMRFLAPFAITQEKLAIMGEPAVESTGKKLEADKEFSFKVLLTPKPTYEIEDFSPVKVKVPEIQVTEAEIDQELLMIAQDHSTYEKEEGRPLQDDDDLFFSIKTIDSKGEEITQLTAERRAYKVGKNYIPGGFDKQLLGMEINETRTFDITCREFNLSETDGPEATETFTFTITLLEIQKHVIPAITDVWVKEHLPTISTVPELREEIRKQGLMYKGKELEGFKSFITASEFAKRFKGSIPDELYEMTRADIMNNLQRTLQAQGRTLKEFVQQQPGGEQQFSMQLMMQTREMLVQGFSLDALARHLKLEISSEDIEETFRLMAPGHEAEARMEFEMTGRMYQIEEGALRNKANKWLVETAEIEYVSEEAAIDPKGDAGAKKADKSDADAKKADDKSGENVKKADKGDVDAKTNDKGDADTKKADKSDANVKKDSKSE